MRISTFVVLAAFVAGISARVCKFRPTHFNSKQCHHALVVKRNNQYGDEAAPASGVLQ